MEKIRKYQYSIPLILIIDLLLLLLWSLARLYIEPVLFGGYTIVWLLLLGVAFGCLCSLINSFWSVQNNARRYILAGTLILLLTSIYYAKLVAVNDRDGQKKFYPMLADAFAHGQFHLIPLPPPEMLALPDPYAPEPKVFPGKIWDAALFNGRYYIYFGPVPAVILMAVNWLFRIHAGNAFLMDLFLSLCALMVFLIIYRIWQRSYQDVSWKVALLCFATVVWSFPIMWLVGRPSVYEAAISGGQAFLLAGLYFLLLAFDKTNGRNFLLIGAGFALGLSVGARWNLAAPVILLSILALVLLLIPSTQKKLDLKPVLAFFVPLTLLAIMYGYYNFIRFGSPFELGAQYQLLGWGRISKSSFSLENIKNNLILYSMMPPADLSYQYPFIIFAGIRDEVAHVYSVYGVTPDPKLGYNIFGTFSAVIWLAPLSLAGLYPVFGLIRDFPGFRRSRVTNLSLIDWLGHRDQLYLVFLTLVACGGIIPLLLFTGTVMRYHMDYFPAVGLLAATGILKLFAIRISLRYRIFVKSLLLLLFIYTVLLGVIASITSDLHLFAVAAPDVINNLNLLIKLFLARVFGVIL